MSKKVISLILGFILLLSFLTISISAEEADNCINVCGESDPFYYDAETGALIDTDNNTPAYFEDSYLTISMPDETSEGSGASPRTSYSPEAFVLHGGFQSYNSSAKTFTWTYDLDCPTALIFKPDVVLYVTLQMDVTDGNGTYVDVVADDPKVYDGYSDWDNDYTFVSPAATGYYRFKWVVTFEGDIYPYYENTSSILLNRTGHKWTFSFDDGRGKTLPMPMANYIKGQLYARDTSLPGRYYTEYTQYTGITLDRSLYDVHHIQPLAYGGDNSYANLIHLPKEIHASVTSWFSGY